MTHSKFIRKGIVCLLGTFALYSCDDTTDTLGTSLTGTQDMIDVTGEEYNVASWSVSSGDIDSRSRIGYLGKIKDPEMSSYVTCNYMTQFRVMSNTQFPQIENVYISPEKYDASIERGKQVEADSCELIFYISSAYGDSLTIMKASANELSIPYEEGQTYISTFDPEAEGMIRTDEGSIHEQMVYTTSNRVYTEAQRLSSKFSNRISLSLNDPYTDKEGNTYNNYGTYLMRCYYDSNKKNSFSNSYKFAHDICPGFYLKHEGGIGNVAKILLSEIVVHFTGNINDSIMSLSSSFAGTEEVMQRSTLIQDEQSFSDMLDDNTCTYVKSPANIFTELMLPIDDIYNGHKNDTINTARIFLPRINNTSSSDYSFDIPQTLLLLPTDSIESFFKNKKIADYRTSYLATYSTQTGGYTFGNISLLISKLYAAKQKGIASDNYNSVTLIPVETTYSTSSSASILTKVTHDMSFASTRLKKGSIDNDNIKISVIYSKFKE